MNHSVLSGNLDFCVLIPCFNNLQGLIVSLKSIYYPTSNFLVVVVDDGSRESINEIELTEMTNLPVRVIGMQQNVGITKALNAGLDWIIKNLTTNYVARLDCGDICAKDRFVKQIEFLKANPQISLLGSWCKFEDELTRRVFYYKSPQHHNDIYKDMYYRNSFMHASVIMNVSLLKQLGFYPTNYEYAEDYALFWEICKSSQVHILPESLVNCLLNRNGISYKNKNKQIRARFKVVRKLAPNSLYKLFGLVKLFFLLLLPKKIILQLKLFMHNDATVVK